ncbi:MAG TPA: MOSC N-terminal beta barrel domain-containing protein [Micromonosporaceae bacterium]
MRLTSIHTYPVKACHRVDHDRIQVEPWGLSGDRHWMVVDANGLRVTQPQHAGLVHIEPRFSDGVLTLRAAGHPDLQVPVPDAGEPLKVIAGRSVVVASAAGPAADAWLARVLDRPVRLAYLKPTHRASGTPVGDSYPLLLTNEASLAAVNDWIAESGSAEGPVPMTRFRPNVVVTGVPPWAEDDWRGGRIRIGSVPFRVGKGCDRCVVTTIDQDTAEQGHEPLRTLARHRNINQELLFGVYLIPDAPGEIAVDDPVTVLD